MAYSIYVSVIEERRWWKFALTKDVTEQFLYYIKKPLSVSKISSIVNESDSGKLIEDIHSNIPIVNIKSELDINKYLFDTKPIIRIDYSLYILRLVHAYHLFENDTSLLVKIPYKDMLQYVYYTIMPNGYIECDINNSFLLHAIAIQGIYDVHNYNNF